MYLFLAFVLSFAHAQLSSFDPTNHCIGCSDGNQCQTISYPYLFACFDVGHNAPQCGIGYHSITKDYSSHISAELIASHNAIVCTKSDFINLYSSARRSLQSDVINDWIELVFVDITLDNNGSSLQIDATLQAYIQYGVDDWLAPQVTTTSRWALASSISNVTTVRLTIYSPTENNDLLSNLHSILTDDGLETAVDDLITSYNTVYSASLILTKILVRFSTEIIPTNDSGLSNVTIYQIFIAIVVTLLVCACLGTLFYKRSNLRRKTLHNVANALRTRNESNDVIEITMRPNLPIDITPNPIRTALPHRPQPKVALFTIDVNRPSIIAALNKDIKPNQRLSPHMHMSSSAAIVAAKGSINIPMDSPVFSHPSVNREKLGKSGEKSASLPQFDSNSIQKTSDKDKPHHSYSDNAAEGGIHTRGHSCDMNDMYGKPQPSMITQTGNIDAISHMYSAPLSTGVSTGVATGVMESKEDDDNNDMYDRPLHDAIATPVMDDFEDIPVPVLEREKLTSSDDMYVRPQYISPMGGGKI